MRSKASERTLAPQHCSGTYNRNARARLNMWLHLSLYLKNRVPSVDLNSSSCTRFEMQNVFEV